MPDLGSYAAEVVLAYGGTLLLLAGIIYLSFAQSRNMIQRLRDIEEDRDGR